MHIDFAKIEDIFRNAENDSLLEHEVYSLLQVIGIQTPVFLFLKKGEEVTSGQLSSLSKDRVVLKICSPQILHKSDVGGVRFVRKDVAIVNQTVKEMLAEVPHRFRNWVQNFEVKTRSDALPLSECEAAIKGVLICEAVDYRRIGFGSELLVGLRHSREFGPVLTVGIGGRDVEYINERLKQGRGLSISSVHLLPKEHIPHILQPLAFYEKLTQPFRGRPALLKEQRIVDLVERFVRLGVYFSSYNGKSEYAIEEAEVNPFVLAKDKLMPMDGVCRFSRKQQLVLTRPHDNIKYLLEPQSMGMIGVSDKKNIGHTILNNVIGKGFPKENIFIVKPGLEEIEGCRCVETVSEIPYTVDLFVLAISAEKSYAVLREIIQHEKARSVIIISGGIGEKKGTADLETRIKALLQEGRQGKKLVPVVNGGNSLGIFSTPGKYDTTFIPEYKIYGFPRKSIRKSGLVYISQSGAFMVSRMSQVPTIEPLYAISIGNQIDLTVSDYLNCLKNNDEARVFAVYLEGFLPGDGLAFARATWEITQQPGKAVVLYKPGRSPEGKRATASHTASIAGDFDVSRSVLQQAGAVVAENIDEFESFIKCFCFLEGKRIRGNRVALISNAGFECVIMADNLEGNEKLRLAEFSDQTLARISKLLSSTGLDQIQDARNPLDLTPVADDQTFCQAVELVLADDKVDCAVISPLPMTPAMQTLEASPYHNEDLFSKKSTSQRLIEIFHRTTKPFVVNIDSGEIYQSMVDLLEKHGVPVFRRCDKAVLVLRKYINHFLARRVKSAD